MNCIYKTVTILMIFSTHLCAQEWVDISPKFSQSFDYLITGTFIDKDEGWMIDWGQTKLFHTINGGTSWEVQFDSSTTYFYDLLFLDEKNGWAKIYDGIPFGNPYIPTLWRTRDCGKTWQRASTPTAFYTFTFIDTLTGFSGGETEFCRTTDGGATWHKSSVEPGIHFGVWDIHFPDSQYGWAVGGSSTIYDAGIVLNTKDGGGTWNVNLHPASATGMGVYFTDRLHGVVVGSNPPFFEGVIMRTEDGGDNWEVQYLPCSWLNDVVFTDDSTGWVVGDLGIIWKTEDGGKTWEGVESGTKADLNRIVFVENGKVGFIFGNNNTLLRYVDSQNAVDEKQGNNIPFKFELYPNCPNPFNDETKIEYTLMDGISVDLRIFDLTGREVVTLVKGFQPSGRHGVKWNGKDKSGKEVSSGVYLCNLKSGIFNLVQKMCLIR